MLDRIVRPLVATQIRLLANSHTTRQTLIETIIRWLGYLGVPAKITELTPNSQEICVSLTVGQPENSHSQDWQKILENLATDQKIEDKEDNISFSEQMTEQQQINLARLLAYILQAGQPETTLTWQTVEASLLSLKLEESLLLMIKSALKVQQSPAILEKIDSDLAAYVFPLAVRLSWLDQKVTIQENEALVGLLTAMK